MKIQNIRITKLFGMFDYSLDFNQEDNLTILTGPNGYGKTTILNIIYNLFNVQLDYFSKLNFEKIAISLASNDQLEIEKSAEGILLLLNKKERYIFTLNDDDVKNQSGLFEGLLSMNKTSREIDLSNKVISFLSKITIYLIKEQRLLKPMQGSLVDAFGSVREDSYYVVIDQYAKKMVSQITTCRALAAEKAQELERTFPQRISKGSKELDQVTFENQVKAIFDKQNKLKQYGILANTIEQIKYSKESSRVLSVYLDDLAQKISAYDDLLVKLEPLLSVLNKRFAFKTISVNEKTGFVVTSSSGELLQLSDLSSGETNLIVLFYELLFEAKADTTLLIDEPENSLHVTWQNEFIDDLLAITKPKQYTLLVATHSPSIIGNRWNQSKDLFDLSILE